MHDAREGREGTGVLFAEDILEMRGRRIRLGRHTMTEPEIRQFAEQWDPLEIHVGDGQHFGRVIASGLHTFAVFQRLAVRSAYSSWAVVAGRAVRDLVMPRPVFPGDVLTGWVRVNGGVPARDGMVKLDVEGHLENQHGDQVLSLRLESYVRSSAGAEGAAEQPAAGVRRSAKSMARKPVTTTADVVAAAARVFEVKGFASATIDDICVEAGISRPTIYKYIEGKPWLLDQMVRLVTEELGEKLHQVHTSPLHPREKIQSLVALHVKSATDQRVYYATVFNEQPELSVQAKAAFRSWSHQVTHSFALLIDEYRAGRAIAAQVDSRVLANLTLTMLTSLFRWYDPNGSTSPEDLTDQVLAMLSGPLPGLEQRGESPIATQSEQRSEG